MNHFFNIILYGYWIIAGYITYIIWRDLKNPHTFIARHKIISRVKLVFLLIGALVVFDIHFIEPWTIKTTAVTVPINHISKPIKIAFISDIQVGNHKKEKWVEKIVERVRQEKPNLLILGGDLIDNEGNTENESLYLDPLKQLVGQFPIYAILGNHEYGIGNRTKNNPQYWVGDRSQSVVDELTRLNIPLLRDTLDCPEIKGQKICLFGIDDIWQNPNPDFSALSNTTTPLIFITHNPDGILSWPSTLPAPALTLAGHTHGGQIYLPFIGPIGSAGTMLSKQYYRGLNYYNNNPIFTSVGIGESGGQLRFWTLPEIAIISLVPKNE